MTQSDKFETTEYVSASAQEPVNTGSGDSAEKPSWRAALLGSDVRSRNISWGAIFAGVVVGIATMIVFSFLGAAIGLGFTDATSNDPFAGVGVGLGIWAVVTVVISFGVGGFVTGTLAVRAGLLHGLATWATTVIGLVIAAALGVSSAFGMVGNVLGGVGNAASSVASAAGDGIDSVTDKLAENVNVDLGEVNQQVEDILAGTGEEKLQPGYLNDQLSGATDEIAEAGKQLVTDPENYQEILENLRSDLSYRVETVAGAIDKDAIANSVANNTDLTGEEAQEATDNAYEAAEKAQQTVEDAVTKASDGIDQAVADAQQFVDDAREGVKSTTDAVSGAAIWAFVALLLSAVLTACAGAWGSRMVLSRNNKGELKNN